MKTEVGIDFIVASNPSFCTIWAETDAARTWLQDWTEFKLSSIGVGHAVEYRYIRDLCIGILDAGLMIAKDGERMVRDVDGALVLE